MSLRNVAATHSALVREHAGAAPHPPPPPTQESQTSDRLGSAAAPFSCNVCKRSYSRVDHLARHYRSHTSEKPFQCDVCGKHFSRTDLLRRHVQAHADGPAKRQKRSNAKQSNRVGLACASCSKAKVRCDDNKPCRRCVQSGLQCKVSEASRDSQQHASPPSLSPMMVHLGIEGAMPSEPCGPELDLPSPSQSPSFQSQEPLQNLNGSTHVTQTDSAFVPQPRDIQPSTAALAGLGDHDLNDFPAAWMRDDSSLADFLVNVMVPSDSPFNANGSARGSDALDRDLFNFGIEDAVGSGDLDFASFTFPNPRLLQPTLFSQPAVEGSSEPPSRADDGQNGVVDSQACDAFMRSLWKWIPVKADQGQCEQLNLSLPSNIGIPAAHTERPCAEPLTPASRDMVMHTVTGTCDPSAVLHIVSQFPSVDVLDCLIQDFLFLHQAKAAAYLHVPSFSPNSKPSELVAMTAAGGAVMSSVPTIRTLGYALQEAVRLAIPRTWEKDNTRTRELPMLQSYALCLDVGLWSGNRRKMEISESHLQPIVTMLRRSGHFKKSRSVPAAPSYNDSAETLEESWRLWVEAESFKRLVFALAIHDAQASMSFSVPPLITNTELALELPSCQSIWQAKSAEQWRDAYLASKGNNGSRLPSISTCVSNPHVLLEYQDQIDIAFSKLVVLSVFWRLIWDSRQISALVQPYNDSALSTNLFQTNFHWKQDFTRAIQHFRMALSDLDSLSQTAALVHEHLLLHIFVSFDELSRFSGKEGTSEARRAFPVLRLWAKGRDARQAVWHAGQIIREASLFQPGALRDFYAIALYHAGLTIWAYGLLTNDECKRVQKSAPADEPTAARGLYSLQSPPSQEIVFLDSEDSASIQKFIALNRASPAVHRVHPNIRTEAYTSTGLRAHSTNHVLLSDPRAALETVIHVLQYNHRSTDQRSMPLLVENLIHLMYDLSLAAMKITDT